MTFIDKNSFIFKNLVLIYLLAVIFVSFFTYFFNYQNPPAPFWDENYHIASSQKYIDGRFFMEPHPPLGKLFIALGEKIINPNQGLNKSNFLDTDYIEGKDFPSGYSFAGVRFFPALFGWLTAPLFFIVLYQLLKNSTLAFVFSSFYAFDNAMIVHFRGAMLDSFLIFFTLSVISYFLYAWQKSKILWWDYLILGILVGLTLSVKLNGLVVVLFPFCLYLKDSSAFLTDFWNKLINKLQISKQDWQEALHFTLNGFKNFVIAGFSLLFVFSFVFLIHFSLTPKTDGRKDSYLNNIQNQQDKQRLDQILESQNQGRGIPNLPLNFFFLTQQSIAYSNAYNQGVPKLDVTKPDENGSSPFTWPFGNRTISYRWAKSNGLTSYLYIVPNPSGWFFALIGIILGTIWIVSKFLFGAKIVDETSFYPLFVITFVYWAYMISVSQIDRVLYLYHYLIPLVLSMLCFVLVFKELTFKMRDNLKVVLALLITSTIFLGFMVYSPLTYYLPLSDEGFKLRNVFEFWQMRLAGT
jgi:dolichyl-phosphate-mannose--protein O-mannosyl transferase